MVRLVDVWRRERRWCAGSAHGGRDATLSETEMGDGASEGSGGGEGGKLALGKQGQAQAGRAMR